MKLNRFAKTLGVITAVSLLLTGCGFLKKASYPKTVEEITTTAKPWSGAYLADGVQDVVSFQNMTKSTINTLLLFRSFGKNEVFNSGEAKMLRQSGIVPMISLEPFDPTKPGNDEPYALKHIIAGEYDKVITTWARGMRDFKDPIMLRFAHEMNGAWYPWGVEINGNTPEEYIAAWRHVHDIFTKEKATNVSWVWSPNIVREKSTYKLSQFYPGDDYVDVMGIVGYATLDTDTFDSIFKLSLDQLAAISDKKVIITETAGSARLKDRTLWFKEFFGALSKSKQVIGFIYFQQNKRQPWELKAGKDAESYGTELTNYQAAWAKLMAQK